MFLSSAMMEQLYIKPVGLLAEIIIKIFLRDHFDTYSAQWVSIWFNENGNKQICLLKTYSRKAR